jgi:Arm DNA-binding domain
MRGHLRERSPGHWAIVLESRDPQTGKRKRKWHSFKGTKREARIECSRLITEAQRGIGLEPSKVTLAEFLHRWLAQISPRTHERYTELVTKNIVPALGSVTLSRLHAVQVSEAYSRALVSGRRDGKGGLSPASVHYQHRVLKKALGQAAKWGLLSGNPLDAVDPPRVERTRMQTYDMAQTAECWRWRGRPASMCRCCLFYCAVCIEVR